MAYVPKTFGDAELITPSHLLRGRRLRTFPKVSITEDEIADPSVFHNRSAITNRYDL